MVADACSAGRGIDLRDACHSLRLIAHTEEQERFLANLYLAFRLGGIVRVEIGVNQYEMEIPEGGGQ